MDIARTAGAPNENFEMADAAPEPENPLLIRREDYRPFPWLVPEIALDFSLGLDRTRVHATLAVQRNEQAEPNPVIRLNGDGLIPLEVKVDGEPVNSWTMEGGDLIVTLPGESHAIDLVTEIDPAANTQLMGLYASNQMLCTQCEAEGFRRITFFPDRPDVLSTYSVRMSGPKEQFSVLLSNGNKIGEGEVDGHVWAQWHDPWAKPSYLFALVAGNLVANRDTFTTMSGRKVDLAIWVRATEEGGGDLPRTDYAMRSLKKAMEWDEEAFGREYDLDTFNIVAVSDFNMGAMENKGLNIFNSKYVLADPETATDGDYDAIESVIGHEYFHNWSGNRVTCRDWFQLSLKEGFTVLRDQLFSQDMGSAAVKRIEDVRVLRSAQFPEDSGPLAHPIRPDEFSEISNFYTATVYNKGAEVIRMMRTLAGPERFRKGCDLYFERHDGEAATCEDFIKAIEDGAGLDLTQFRLWYSQAGTPRVGVRMDREGGTITLHLTQKVPPTPGQEIKEPMPIPLRLALFDRGTGEHRGEQLVVLDSSQEQLSFPDTGGEPVLSINRGFSAPISVERELSREDLVFLAAHDDDPFARYEAMQDLILGHLRASIEGNLPDAERGPAREAIGHVMATVITDPALDDLMRGELMMLPSQSYLAEQMPVADPSAVHEQREGLKAWLGHRLEKRLLELYERLRAAPYELHAAARGARKLKMQVLVLLAAAKPEKAAEMAVRQYRTADNMTDRQAALIVLAGLDIPLREEMLADFYRRYQGNALVIDKWFALQAQSIHPRALEHVRVLANHPDFTLRNPNRVRSLYMAFAGNPHAFHAASGEGYRMIADLILRLDPINPQTAARFVAPLGRWRRIEPIRAALMREQLERIAAAPKLSRDTREQVSRSLG